MAGFGHGEQDRTDPRAFYDGLASTYHRLYPEWDAEIRVQAEVLDRILRRQLGEGPHCVLDCAVGIGTQALGLAMLGHRVVGLDLSHGALRRAEREADRLAADVSLISAGMHALPFVDGAVDAVVCVDAVAHLQSVEDLIVVLREMARVVRPSGLVLMSIRDYDTARRDRPPGTLPQVNRTPPGETIAFQVWDWHPDGSHYDLTHVVLESAGHGWAVTTRTATLRAFVGAEMVSAAASAGLVDVGWRLPAESGFFQPLLMARATPGPPG